MAVFKSTTLSDSIDNLTPADKAWHLALLVDLADGYFKDADDDNAFAAFDSDNLGLRFGAGGTYALDTYFRRTDANQFTFNADLYPEGNATRDLGSAAAKWKDVYVGGSVVFAPIAAPAHVEGHVFFDSTEHALMVDSEGGSRNALGQETWFRAINSTGDTISDASPVYVSGQTGRIKQISLAKADDIATSETIGLTTREFAPGDTGFVTTFGDVNDVDTSDWEELDDLYVSPTTAGGLTNVKPDPKLDQIVVHVGSVIVKDSEVGQIHVHLHNSVSYSDLSGIPAATYKSYPFSTRGIGIGEFYVAGHYGAPLTSTTITNASPTQVYGGANHPHAAHAFIVASAAGTASGGSGLVEIEVSGVSITDAGVRTPDDSEVIVADITALTTDAYFETSKKWLGDITWTIQNAGGSTQTTFSVTINYGFAKYEDFGNIDFTVSDFEATGLAGNNGTLDLELLVHTNTGWTYHATAFQPGNGAIAQMSVDYGADVDLDQDKYFDYKRDDLSTIVNGDNGEGVLVRITVGSNNLVQSMCAHIGFIT